ncbi:MAG: lysophospholipid acyltransferase family protein [Negativicutes bacterium]|nr:lysophospholipid acyltransferase family protein [Negativicutes bacterium]
MQYKLVKTLSYIACRAPNAFNNLFAAFLGRLSWAVAPGWRKKMAVNNIVEGLRLDQMQATAIAKASVIRFGRMFIEVLRVPLLTKENIREVVAVEGSEHLAAALSQGRGVILATAHTGNWELLGAALALYGFPLVAVVKKQRNGAMDRFINEYRRLAGMHVTYNTGVREMIRLLNEGRIIGLLMDQDAHANGVFVNFLGRPASTPAGAAALARLNNAPIVSAFIKENGDGTHTAILHPPFFIDKTADRERDIRQTTQYLVTVLEKHIRSYPQEWFWLHNRWKTRPPAGLVENYTVNT